jgi:hypothetical protein
MNDGRMRHSLTTVRRGREVLVLAAGGCCVEGEWLYSLATSEVYSVVANTWTRAGDMASPRKEAAMASLKDGSALIAGGEDMEQFLDVAERFNPNTLTWQPVAGRMPDQVAELPMVVFPDGTVLIAGGTRSDTFYTASDLGAIYDATLGDPD